MDNDEFILGMDETEKILANAEFLKVHAQIKKQVDKYIYNKFRYLQDKSIDRDDLRSIGIIAAWKQFLCDSEKERSFPGRYYLCAKRAIHSEIQKSRKTLTSKMPVFYHEENATYYVFKIDKKKEEKK